MHKPSQLARFVPALALLAALAPAPAMAGGIADTVTVVDPYVRAVPPVVKTSAAFMQIRSEATSETFLVDASTPLADAAELHMHVKDGEVMRMRRIPHVHLPAGTTVTLRPGGLHIMLFGLKRAIQPGQEVPITLTFEDGSRKDVVATVLKPGAR